MEEKATVRYTRAQLEALKESPLVRKPDRLPDIQQWMEPQSDQNNRKARPATATDNENQRPSLLATRHFSRTSTGAEDIVLGPSRIAFASASSARTLKNQEGSDKPLSYEEEKNGERYSHRERFFKDRDDRNRDRPGFTNGRRNPRDDGEGWTSVRNRKALETEDNDRGQKQNIRERGDKGENDDAPPRRNGAGRSRFEWGARDDTTGNKDAEMGKFSSSKMSGWRERDRERDRRDDRERRPRFDDDDAPEWMVEEAPSGHDKKAAPTQEDFQRWKEEMKNKNTRQEPKKASEPVEMDQSEAKPTQGQQSSVQPIPKPAQQTPLPLPFGDYFGTLGKSSDASTPVKTAPSKSKTSKFATFFAPQEENKPVANPSPAQVQAGSLSPPAAGSNDDQKGFQRILDMLKGPGLLSQAGPTSPEPSNNDSKQAMRSNGFQHNQSLGLEQPTTRHGPTRSKEERDAILESILPKSNQSPFGISSPSNNSAWGAPPSSRPDTQPPRNQPPSRNTGDSGADGLQSLFARPSSQAQAHPPNQTDAGNRQFLLGLLKHGTPSQTPNRENGHSNPDPSSASLYHSERGTTLQQPRPRGPQAGFFDISDQDIYNRGSIEAEHTEQSRKPTRPPPGFHDEQPLPANHHARASNDLGPRLPMSNMGIPQQQQQQHQQQPDPNNWMQYEAPRPKERVPPPPGFQHYQARQQQQQQPQPQPQAGPNYPPPQMQFPGANQPMGPPPGLQRGGMFQAPAPMGPPPGFFGGPGPGAPGGGGGPPPGFPPMGMPQDLLPPQQQQQQQRRPTGPFAGFDMFPDPHMQMHGQRRGGPPPPGPYM